MRASRIMKIDPKSTPARLTFTEIVIPLVVIVPLQTVATHFASNKVHSSQFVVYQLQKSLKKCLSGQGFENENPTCQEFHIV